MYEDKGETYDPTEDGFVFSEDQINDNPYAPYWGLDESVLAEFEKDRTIEK
jgi:hypothetical protein